MRAVKAALLAQPAQMWSVPQPQRAAELAVKAALLAQPAQVDPSGPQETVAGAGAMEYRLPQREEQADLPETRAPEAHLQCVCRR